MITIRASWSEEQNSICSFSCARRIPRGTPRHLIQVTAAEVEERTETQPRGEPQITYYYHLDFVWIFANCSGPKGPAIPGMWTRTAFRLDVGKMHLFVGPILASNRGPLPPCAPFPTASRSPSQGETRGICASFLASRAALRCSVSPMPRAAVHANYRGYWSQQSKVLSHYFESARSDAGADDTQDSDRPILQVRGRIAAVCGQSIPESMFDLTERSCCMHPNWETVSTRRPAEMIRT